MMVDSHNCEPNEPFLPLSCFLSDCFITATDMELEHRPKPNFIHILNRLQNDYSLSHTKVPPGSLFLLILPFNINSAYDYFSHLEGLVLLPISMVQQCSAYYYGVRFSYQQIHQHSLADIKWITPCFMTV